MPANQAVREMSGAHGARRKSHVLMKKGLKKGEKNAK
jgi:hypothetical protein